MEITVTRLGVMEYNEKKQYLHFGNSRRRQEKGTESTFKPIKDEKLPEPGERNEHLNSWGPRNPK